MDTSEHWEHIYRKRRPEQQGWFSPIPQPSLDWITSVVQSRNTRVLDAGGGASTLVDHLLDAGFRHLTVLDISQAALEQSQLRLGSTAANVHWRCSNVLSADLAPESVDLWHDRAVFHFLHTDLDRATYKAQVLRTLSPDGVLIAGSFRPGAPPTCSGLPVRHHSAEEIAAFFGPELVLEEQMETTHVTPGDVVQDYIFVRLRRHGVGKDT